MLVRYTGITIFLRMSIMTHITCCLDKYIKKFYGGDERT